MGAKTKGTAAERELVHLFWASGWAAIRVAGSGSNQYPSPDLVCGNGLRRLVIECKTTSSTTVYLGKKEIEELRIFAHHLAAEAWVGVRFKRTAWLFVGMEELEETHSSYAVHRKTAELRGLGFNELIEKK